MGWELGKLDRSTIKEVARHRAEKGERSSLQAGGGKRRIYCGCLSQDEERRLRLMLADIP